MTINHSEYKILPPFKAWVQQALPAVYDDSLSYTDLLSKLLYYVNALTENNTTLSNDVKNAIDYINNYFNNLDVQDEINKKLDSMATDGTLEELIGKYITKKNQIVFESVQDMLASNETKENGNYLCYGYLDKFDGGKGYYIATKTRNDSKWQLTNGTLYFTLINDNPVNLSSFGGHTSSDILKKAFAYAMKNKFNIVGNGEYTTNEPLIVTESIDINVKTIISNNFTDYALKFDFDYSKEPELNKVEVRIDCKTVSSGIDVTDCKKTLILNSEIININKCGIRINSGYECYIENTHLYCVGENNIGILLNTSDCVIDNCVGIDCHTFIKANQLNQISQCHAWIARPELLSGSIFVDLGEQYMVGNISNCYSDTYETTIYVRNYSSSISIDNLLVNYNPSIYNQSNVNNSPRYLFYFNGVEGVNISYSDRIALTNADIQDQNSKITGQFKFSNIDNNVSNFGKSKARYTQQSNFTLTNLESLTTSETVILKFTSNYLFINLIGKIKASVSGNELGTIEGISQTFPNYERLPITLQISENEYGPYTTNVYGNFFLTNGVINVVNLSAYAGKYVRINTMIPLGFTK